MNCTIKFLDDLPDEIEKQIGISKMDNRSKKICFLKSDFNEHFNTIPPILSKHDFSFNRILSGLNWDASILEQRNVVITYEDKGQLTTVPVKHGVITLFEINQIYYLLGSLERNPALKKSDKPELKASIGGMSEANTKVPLITSINQELQQQTGNLLNLNNFTLSSYYVCHRSAEWNEWSVCFIKTIALYKETLTLDKLAELTQELNKVSSVHFGIYRFEDIKLAASKTAGLEESTLKVQTPTFNFYSGRTELAVIFDDNALNQFKNLPIHELFKDELSNTEKVKARF